MNTLTAPAPALRLLFDRAWMRAVDARAEAVAAEHRTLYMPSVRAALLRRLAEWPGGAVEVAWLDTVIHCALGVSSLILVDLDDYPAWAPVGLPAERMSGAQLDMSELREALAKHA